MGEAYGFQAAGGTFFDTCAAVGAFFVVDDRQIVLDSNGTVGAGLFAFLTADAGIFACLSGIRTLLGVTAENDRLGILRDHGDDPLGAGAGTKAATDAMGSIDSRDPVAHADGTGGASGGAITEP